MGSAAASLHEKMRWLDTFWVWSTSEIVRSAKIVLRVQSALTVEDRVQMMKDLITAVITIAEPASRTDVIVRVEVDLIVKIASKAYLRLYSKDIHIASIADQWPPF